MITKCEICNTKLETNHIGKLIGTIVKTKENETSKAHYVCSSCQKEHKNNLKEKLS